jgi:hypothetical protein
MQLTLQNNYLPRLDDADVVEYDVVEQTIRPGVNFAVMRDFLTNVDERDLSWSGQ